MLLFQMMLVDDLTSSPLAHHQTHQHCVEAEMQDGGGEERGNC